MSAFINHLTAEFKRNENTKVAVKQEAYMRGQFEYYGLKTEIRREIQKPFLVKEFLPEKDDLEKIVKILWEKPQREYHYFAQEFVFKYIKQFEKEDILLYEYMVTHNSWWDTVDFIATKLIGSYFKVYPDQRVTFVQRWLSSNNIWLQRAALIFQLKYKKELDTDLLSTAVNALLGTNEFFINKAIGWVLREYTRTNPQWVIEFVERTDLSKLSRNEALRLINQSKI